MCYFQEEQSDSDYDYDNAKINTNANALGSAPIQQLTPIIENLKDGSDLQSQGTITVGTLVPERDALSDDDESNQVNKQSLNKRKVEMLNVRDQDEEFEVKT